VNEEKHFIKTDTDYKRYAFTETGVSPRGIPGYGDGLVRADSDEHDEMGLITEDVHNIRPKMVQKRWHKRYNLLKSNAKPPKLYGNDDYEILVVAWGSTYHAIKEAIDVLENDDIALLHFSQVYPLHKSIKDYLEKARKIVFIENNARGQFMNLVRLETNFDIEQDKVTKFLKYNGITIAVEEIVEFLEDQI